jgi:hypothetical protein
MTPDELAEMPTSLVRNPKVLSAELPGSNRER